METIYSYLNLILLITSLPAGIAGYFVARKQYPQIALNALPVASISLRVLAYLIDTFVIASLVYIAKLTLQMVGQDLTVVHILVPIITISIFYYTFFEGSKMQASPGKFFLGLQVTNLTGQKISFAKSSLRYALSVFSHLLMFVGVLLSLFTKYNQTLHDALSYTIVISKAK